MFELDELIRELYIKYPELSKSEIELICRTEFRFIWEKIQSGKFENLNLKHIGKFIVKDRSRKFWEEKLKDEDYIKDYQLRRATSHERYKKIKEKADSNKKDV